MALDLRSGEEVAGAYQRLLTAGKRYDPEARIILQKMARPGVEMIVGTLWDSQFGPVIMVGMGGIFAVAVHPRGYTVLDAQMVIK